MTAELLVAYCVTIFVASITPGPSMLLALTQGARFGWTAGALGGVGNVSASLVQATVSLLILIQVGLLSDTVLLILKYCGAAYIIYIGICIWQVKSFGDHPSEEKTAKPQESGLSHVKSGFLFAIGNPKAIMFFAALFPQFIRDGKISAESVATIYIPIIVIGYLCFMIYVVGGVGLMQLIGKSRHTGKVFGGIIAASGLALAFT